MIDAHLIGQVLLAALAGGMIGLDRTAAGQLMISQPIVAAPLTGWLLGDPAAGLVVGAVLELLWVLDMPIGTFVPADSTLAAVVATAVAVIGSGDAARPGIIGFSILFTVVTAPASMAADKYVRQRNGRLASWAEAAEDAGIEARVTAAQGAGMALFFLKMFLLCLVFVPLGVLALRAYDLLPAPFPAAMALFLKLLLLLGAALIIRRLSREPVDRFVLFGIVIAMIATMLFGLPPAAAVLCTLVAGWLGVRYHER